MRDITFEYNIASYLLNIEGVHCLIYTSEFNNNSAVAIQITNSNLSIYSSNFNSGDKTAIAMSVVDNGVSIEEKYSLTIDSSTFSLFVPNFLLSFN